MNFNFYVTERYTISLIPPSFQGPASLSERKITTYRGQSPPVKEQIRFVPRSIFPTTSYSQASPRLDSPKSSPRKMESTKSATKHSHELTETEG